MKGDRSGTFWPFWEIIKSLKTEDRNPPVITLENVCGTLSSHNGKDFAAIGNAFRKLGYKFGAVVIDAALFVPQSRPRLFIIGVQNEFDIPVALKSDAPLAAWHSRALKSAYQRLSSAAKADWIWWNIPSPALRNCVFEDLIEIDPSGVLWHSEKETQKLLSMMSDINLQKVEHAKIAGRKMVGTVYKRTRRDEYGRKVQRAEIRFDDVAGCLRTPAGGSSRQLIMTVDGKEVRSRLISSRETARLMGLPDEYELPKNYNEAYHLTGDGVAVPVVRHLARHIFEPILNQQKVSSKAAA